MHPLLITTSKERETDNSRLDIHDLSFNPKIVITIYEIFYFKLYNLKYDILKNILYYFYYFEYGF